MYGIIYTNKEEAYAKREEIKMELQAEYQKRKEPSDEFIDAFVKKHNVCFPNDIVFDTDGVFEYCLSDFSCNTQFYEKRKCRKYAGFLLHLLFISALF